MLVGEQEACQLLQDGVVALPTETVYGLAARYSDEKAVAEIFRLKGRPAQNPLIVHISDLIQLDTLVTHKPEGTQSFIEAFWPGPLTLVLPARCEVIPAAVRAGLPTVAVRMPSHPLTRAVIAQMGPLVMPSANLSGKPSATAPSHVEHDFGAAFPVLDGGHCEQGLESTVLAYQNGQWSVARPGSITIADICAKTGIKVAEAAPMLHPTQPISPGQLFKHYAPLARLIPSTDLSAIPSNCIVVGFKGVRYADEVRLYSLGVDTASAAHRLYAVLRQLDDDGVQQAYVDMSFSDEGMGAALRDRLLRACEK